MYKSGTLVLYKQTSMTDVHVSTGKGNELRTSSSSGRADGAAVDAAGDRPRREPSGLPPAADGEGATANKKGPNINGNKGTEYVV